MKKFLPFLFITILIILPSISLAVDAPLVSSACGIKQADGIVNRECGYYDLLQLVNTIINWVIMISFPVAAGVFAWAGFIYMTTGVSDQKSYAKGMLLKVFIGFVFILSAWIIVGTLTKALLKNPSIVPVDTRP